MVGDGILGRMGLLPSAHGQRPWHTTLLNAMRIVTAGLVLVDGATGTMAAVPVLAAGPLAWLGAAGAVGGVLAMAFLLVRGVERFRWHAAAVVMVWVGLSVGLTGAWNGGIETEQWWPIRYVLASIMFIVVAGRTWRRLILLAILVAFHLTARLATWSAEGQSWGLELARQLAAELGLAAFSAFVMFVIMETLLRAGDLTDRAHADAVREADRAASAGARERSAREVDRFIHDEVLHTLRTIAMDRRDVPEQAARAAAARLDRLLVESPMLPAGHHIADRIREAAAELPLTVEFSAEAPVVVPEDVEEAMVLASLEALRNVSRHAGVSQAHVRVFRDGLTAMVEVSDRGVGFHAHEFHRSWGLNSSIHQRMADVGGDAAIESQPGEGTTVLLSWTTGRAPRSPQFRNSAGYGALSELYVLTSYIMLPYFALTLWNAAWLAPTLAVPWAGWAAALILVSVTTAIGVSSLRRGPRPRCAVVLVLAAWGTTALNGWALPAGVTDPYAFWAGTAALAVVVPLTIFHWPPLIGLAGLGTAALVLAFTLDRAGAELAGTVFMPVIVQPLVSTGAFLAVRLVLDALAWETHRTGEESARSRAAAQARSEFIASLAARMDARREAIASFVRGVSDGTLDSRDPTVRARAEALERSARDEMLPDLDVDLRTVAGRLRELGHGTTVRLAEDVPAEVQRHGAQALSTIVTASRRHDRIDVTLTIMRAGDAWRTALLIASPRRSLRERLVDSIGPSWTVDSESEFVHLSTTIPAAVDNETNAART